MLVKGTTGVANGFIWKRTIDIGIVLPWICQWFLHRYCILKNWVLFSKCKLFFQCCNQRWHYDDVIMTMLASQITSLMVVYSIVYLGVNQRKHQSSASLAFVREIHRGPVNFPHKWPVTRKMFPLDDVIMEHCWPGALVATVLSTYPCVPAVHRLS